MVDRNLPQLKISVGPDWNLKKDSKFYYKLGYFLDKPFSRISHVNKLFKIHSCFTFFG